MEQPTPEETLARFEELDLLESEFNDVELELIRKTEALHAPLYKKRASLVTKIPHFWALVFEQSPPEFDNFFQPSDSAIFAECLETLHISRFELDDPNGSPRSFDIEFGFSENQYFENKVLKKRFWYRVAADGWQGHVSEPVKIDWKKGKDVTGGLTDAACALLAARKGLKEGVKETELKEYAALARKIEQSDESSNSFFTWFAFVSSYKWVSQEESEKAVKALRERMEKIAKGEKVEESEPPEEQEEEDEEQDYQETEVFPQGDEVAMLLADEMWPNAIKYYKMAHEADDEELSGIDEDIDDGFDESDDDQLDIRGLVGKGRNSKSGDSPPPKKQRKS